MRNTPIHVSHRGLTAVCVIVLALDLWCALSPARATDATPPSEFLIGAAKPQNNVPGTLDEAVEKARYRIRAYDDTAARTGTARTYKAVNALQALRATFTDSGVRVTPGAASSAAWGWSMSLRGLGYGAQVQPVGTADLVATGNRMEYRRGPLTEWYVNDRNGLEQGFTLAQPPVGRTPSEPLVVVLSVKGNLRAEIGKDRDQVHFVDKRGAPVLSYSKLAAFDATGARLPARMRLGANEVRLEVEDHGAAYPITIDPVIASETKLEPSRDSAEFGRSVAIDGDTAVVGNPRGGPGAPFGSGSAYVFRRTGGRWVLEQEVFATDGTPEFDGDRFAEAVAISGNTIVVGAPNDDTTTGQDTGRAYVFVRSDTQWSEQERLIPRDPQGSPIGAPGDNFGSSVAISGDTVIVGAPGDDASSFNAGAAYVFIRTGTAWTQEMKLAPSPAVGGFVAFGRSVAIDRDTAVVGVPDYRSNPCCFGFEIGSAYVFVRTGTTWSQPAQLFASDAAPPGQFSSARFGSTVAISGDTIVVGDPFAGPAVRSGQAYVFVRPPNSNAWTQQGPPLLASDASFFDGFGAGYSVAISGETIVIGVGAGDTPRGVDTGAAYIFIRSGTTWSEQVQLFASDAAVGDWFGASVGISGDTAVVGSPFANTTTVPGRAGAAYVYGLSSPVDLRLAKQASPNPVTTGQNVTYTLTVTNEGSAAASNVVVTDVLPASTTFVGCESTQGGVCGGTGNNRTITFPSLAPTTTATITLTAAVSCSVANGTAISNTASVTSDTTDRTPENNTATAQTAASDPPPRVVISGVTASLWPSDHRLVNVGLAVGTPTDNCPGVSTQVLVFGDEDDQTPTGGGTHSPDAKNIAPGTLVLRAERNAGGDGRVYLIIVKATDSGGNLGFAVHTVVVPKSNSPADIDSVNSQAAAARAQALASNGSPPPGYFVIGDGPVIGPIQ